MWKSICRALAALVCAVPCFASELTATEQRWLRGAAPVLAYARQAGVPLDVVVQPQPTPGMPPLALAFVDGRCKLVLSMRGNPEAQATLERIDPGLLDAALELMAAHELGHCQRYLEGAWRGLPAGFVPWVPSELSPELQEAHRQMQAVRLEEAYGDLVGLAWTQRHHPALYARLHGWLVDERSKDLIAGSHHDTLVWVRLARQGSVLNNRSIFASAAALWTAGLRIDEAERARP